MSIALPPHHRRTLWPEPSPVSAAEMPPAVLKIPARERLDFAWHVTTRYVGMIATLWPAALAYAARSVYPRRSSDEEFARLVWDSAIAKILCPTLDAVDADRFAAVMAELRLGDADVAKLDTSALDDLERLPGLHTAGTVTLFRRPLDGAPARALAIAINGLVVRPGDAAWELAKLFALQGASQHMVGCHHIPMHFPLDAVNAFTKSILPPDHLVARLLAPHFRFSLSLTDAALHSRMSILANPPLMPYSVFPQPSDEVYRLARMGYAGRPGNSGYPSYRFSPDSDPVMGDYGTFHRRWYEAMLAIARPVAAAVEPGDPFVRAWAEAAVQWLPGFPRGHELSNPDLRARTLAKIIWTATVGHAADHYAYADIPIEQVPLRLRVPPPASRDEPFPPQARLARRADCARHYMAWRMFFREETVTRLRDVRYDFGEPALERANDHFLEQLAATEATMPVRRFMPLDRIPASVQF